AAFAVVRLGELYRSPAGQAAVKQLQAGAPHVLPGLEKLLGVPLAQVETVTAVVPTQTDRNSLFSAALTVGLNTPHEPADLVKALREPDLDCSGLPPGVYPLKDSVEATFTVADGRHFTVFPTERARRDFAELWLRREGQRAPSGDMGTLLVAGGHIETL